MRRLMTLTLVYFFAFNMTAQVTHYVGSYTGDDAATQAIIGVGFQPDVIMVKPDNGSLAPWTATSTMTSGEARSLKNGSPYQNETGIISSIDSDGFTVGTDNRSNKLGVTYYFVCFEAGANLEVGSYTGNQSTQSTSFEPEMIWLFGDSNNWYDFASFKWANDNNVYLWDGTEDNASYTLIGNLTSSGFNTGTASRTAGKDYHWVAFNSDASQSLHSSYTGDNNSSGKSIATSPNMKPSFLMIHRDQSDIFPLYLSSMPAGYSAKMSASSLVSDLVVGTSNTGFDVANSGGTNAIDNYNFFALEGASVLPVELLDFNVSRVNNKPLLDWTTGMEENSSHFEIERSLNGNSFEHIASVFAAGASQTSLNYLYKDEPQRTTVYYRLKMVDNDGSYTYSSIRKLENKSINVDYIKAFPNPFMHSINLEITSNYEEEVIIEIVNEEGKKVYSAVSLIAPSVNEINISTTMFAPGMYQVKVIKNYSPICSIKLMKLNT